MRKNNDDGPKTTPQEALSNLLRFVNDDPLTMGESELDQYLAESGIDFKKFDVRLTADISGAIKKARLIEARESRKDFLSQAKNYLDIAAMTIEQKRAEIQERLGLLSGNAAAVFNRNYADAEDEEELDGLLADLRALDERDDS